MEELEDLGAGGGRRGKGGQQGGKGGRGGGNGQAAQPGRGGQAGPVDRDSGGGEGGGGKSMKKEAPKSLRDTIVSWNVDDISADKNEVPTVRGFHECTEDYMTTYRNLLVQECRAKVKDSLQNIESSISYNIAAILPTKSEMKHFIDIDLSLDAKINYHVAKEGDLFLFSYYSPQTEAFNYTHRSIGIASDISVHSQFHKGFMAYSPKKFGNFKYATFLTNVNDSLNAWNVMHLENTENNCSGINSIMKLPTLPIHDCTCCPRPVDLNSFVFNELSEEQKKIVSSVAEAVQCKESNIVKLVSAPPGSGKTLIISKVLNILHPLSMNTIVCVPTENDVISLLLILQGSGYQLNDLIVLDSLDGRKINTKARQACLLDRSHDLLCCIKMFKQWVHEMLLLLNLEKFCTEGCDHESAVRCIQTHRPIFTLNIFRMHFSTLVTNLRHCLEELRDRFSGMFLTTENISDILKLLKILKHLENLLCLEIEDEKSVLRAFGLVTLGPSTSGLPGCSVAEELNRVRLACSEAVENLRDSIELPKGFAEREEVEEYCIDKCQLIVTTICSAFRLHKLRADRIDLLIVDDSSHITECNLTVPLRLPIRHIWMLGDDKMQTIINKVPENDGFSNCLFNRLSQLGFPVDSLMKQYRTDPAIFLFPNKRFYDGKILDGQNVESPHYSAHFKHLNEHQNYLFYDVGDSYNNESIDMIEEAAILSMLQAFCRGWQGVERKLEIAVICLYSSRSDAIKAHLIKKHATRDRINVHVKCANSLQGEIYDVIILTALSIDPLPKKNKDHKAFVQDQDIISTLTKARHCLWILFQKKQNHYGVFNELVNDAANRKCIMRLDESLFSVNVNSANNAVSRKMTTESTWQGRPHNTKDILGDMRDQKSSDTCTLHSSLVIVESLKKFEYAGFHPPKDFRWILSADKLGIEFKKITKKDIGEEVDVAQKGFYRLETVQNILQKIGAIGHNTLQDKDETLQERNFKIKSYCRLDIRENKGMDDAVLAIRRGTVLSGYFRISRNYFSLKPGEIYHYDDKKPYLSPLHYIPASHVVMMIGSGATDTSTELPSGDLEHEKDVHLNFQNSAGKLFGDAGFGKVGWRSVRGLYQMTV